MKTEYDVVIIGAGPAGSTAAILLAQAGWSVVLIEKQQFPRRKVCGECIAAPNLDLMERLGVADEFLELAGPELRRVAIMSGAHTVSASLPSLGGRHSWGRALGREYFDALLLKRAEQVGVKILQPWAVRSVEGSAGDFSCKVKMPHGKDSMLLSAPVVIAACGSWEPQPFLPGPKAEHKPGDLFAFKANFSQGDLAPGLLPVLAFPGGYGGMVLGDHGMLTLACCIRRDTLEKCRRQYGPGGAANAVEAYLRENCVGVEHTLRGARREEAWLSVGPIRPDIRVDEKTSDIFMIGNAAGEAHPIIGEGISMAMQSAWLLCSRLAQGGREMSAETCRIIRRQYVRDWHKNFSSRLRLSALFAHLAMHPRVSRAILPVLERWPGFLTYGARASGKIRQPQFRREPA